MQNQMAYRGVNQPHLQHLGQTVSLIPHQTTAHHHGEDHGGGLANAMLGVGFELACDVQHICEVGHHVALRQTRAKQQRARKRPVLHEDLLRTLDFAAISPIWHSAALPKISLQSIRDQRIGAFGRAPVG